MSRRGQNQRLICILCDVEVRSSLDLIPHIRHSHGLHIDWWNCGERDCVFHTTSHEQMCAHRIDNNHHSKGTSALDLIETIARKCPVLRSITAEVVGSKGETRPKSAIGRNLRKGAERKKTSEDGANARKGAEAVSRW